MGPFDLFNFGRQFQLKTIFSLSSSCPALQKKSKKTMECGASISSGASLSPLFL
jgi:hypothetical protein